MTTYVDLQLVGGLGLPYEPGAEAGLAAAGLDPTYALAWQGLVAAFPGTSLQPLYDALPLAELTDLLDAIRTNGDEPPDLLSCFSVPVADELAEAVATALQGLPFVQWAMVRQPVFPAGTVSSGTNPLTPVTLQLQPAPFGVDALYAWEIPGGSGAGVELADIEGGWDTTHQDLRDAKIIRVSTPGPERFIAHGTGMAGIVVAADNGVGMLGVAPDARLGLVSDVNGVANAVLIAARHVGIGGVVLIEAAEAFVPGGGPDIPVEANRGVQLAIRTVTLFGTTVIEPAGNRGVNLDDFPFLAHLQPDSPSFVDSHAIMVGGGHFDHAQQLWRQVFTFGTRVDCFGPGTGVVCPTNTAVDAYVQVNGTSPASAVIAGIATAIQGMAVTNDGGPIHGTDIRNLVRDPQLCTPMSTGMPGGRGGLPDLRKIAQRQGWHAILPVGAAATADGFVIAFLDDDLQLQRISWDKVAGWGQPTSASFELVAGQPAVLSTAETTPVARRVHEAYLVGPLGLHHLWWDSTGQAGDVSKPVAAFTTVAQGKSVAAVRALTNLVVVAAIDPAGRLTAFTGDPGNLVAGMSTPLVLDSNATFRRTAGPVAVTTSAGGADVVAVDDAGILHWYHGTALATIGTGWQPGVAEPSSRRFDIGSRPALTIAGDKLLAVGAGHDDGWLRAVTIDPGTGTVDPATVVDVTATVDAQGPVALTVTGSTVVALFVDGDGGVRTTTRPVAGGDWTASTVIPSANRIKARGGATAVALPGVGVMALGFDANRFLKFSLSVDGVIWSPFLPLP